MKHKISFWIMVTIGVIGMIFNVIHRLIVEEIEDRKGKNEDNRKV